MQKQDTKAAVCGCLVDIPAAMRDGVAHDGNVTHPVGNCFCRRCRKANIEAGNRPPPNDTFATLQERIKERLAVHVAKHQCDDRCWTHGLARETIVALDTKDAEIVEHLAEVANQVNIVGRQRREIERLTALINTPEIHDFTQAEILEAAFQREKWGVDSDAGKTNEDWFWLIGYLAGKSIRPGASDEKRLHRVVTIAAAARNWHAALLGNTNMRPGIETPKGETV